MLILYPFAGYFKIECGYHQTPHGRHRGTKRAFSVSLCLSSCAVRSILNPMLCPAKREYQNNGLWIQLPRASPKKLPTSMPKKTPISIPGNPQMNTPIIAPIIAPINTHVAVPSFVTLWVGLFADSWLADWLTGCSSSGQFIDGGVFCVVALFVNRSLADWPSSGQLMGKGVFFIIGLSEYPNKAA